MITVTHRGAPPVVEIDSTVRAAYIRFSDEEVASTEPVEEDDLIINVDRDASGQVVGIELVGVDDFNILSLVEKAHVTGISDALARRAHYVPTVAGLALRK